MGFASKSPRNGMARKAMSSALLTSSHAKPAAFSFSGKVASASGWSALTVNAGHGLTYHNVQPVAALPGIHELNIGHAIVAQALFVGWKEAVAEMKRLMVEAAG